MFKVRNHHLVKEVVKLVKKYNDYFEKSKKDYS